MANNAQVLLFHVDAKKAVQIEGICRPLKIKVNKVKMSSYPQKLGYLAGISGFNRENITYTGTELPSEMLVFSGMDSDTVDCFLAAYKKASIPPIGLKAILTSHNINWSAEALYKELYREHMSFMNKQ